MRLTVIDLPGRGLVLASMEPLDGALRPRLGVPVRQLSGRLGREHRGPLRRHETLART